MNMLNTRIYLELFGLIYISCETQYVPCTETALIDHIYLTMSQFQLSSVSVAMAT